MSAPGPAPGEGEGGAACCGEPRAPRPAPAGRGPGGTCWEGGWAAAGPASPAAPGRSLRGLAGASRPRQKGLKLQRWGWGSLEPPHVRCRLCPSLGQLPGGVGLASCIPASLHPSPGSIPGRWARILHSSASRSRTHSHAGVQAQLSAFPLPVFPLPRRESGSCPARSTEPFGMPQIHRARQKRGN